MIRLPRKEMLHHIEWMNKRGARVEWMNERSPHFNWYSSDQISGNVSVWLLLCYCCFCSCIGNGSISCCPIDISVPDTYCVGSQKRNRIHCTLLNHHGVPSKIGDAWCWPQRKSYVAFSHYKRRTWKKYICIHVTLHDIIRPFLFVLFYFILTYFNSMRDSCMHACTQYAIEFDCVWVYVVFACACIMQCVALIDGGSLFTLRSLYHTPGLLSIYIIYIFSQLRDIRAHWVRERERGEGERGEQKKLSKNSIWTREREKKEARE